MDLRTLLFLGVPADDELRLGTLELELKAAGNPSTDELKVSSGLEDETIQETTKKNAKQWQASIREQETPETRLGDLQQDCSGAMSQSRS